MAVSVSGPWQCQFLGHGSVSFWAMAVSVSGPWQCQFLGHGSFFSLLWIHDTPTSVMGIRPVDNDRVSVGCAGRG